MFTWYIGPVSDMYGVLKELVFTSVVYRICLRYVRCTKGVDSVYMVYRTCLRYVRCTKGVSVYMVYRICLRYVRCTKGVR